MGWLLRHNWLWALLAFLLGAVITWFLLVRREQSVARVAAGQEAREPAEEKVEALVGAGVGAAPAQPTARPAARTTPPPPPQRFDDPTPDEPATVNPDEPRDRAGGVEAAAVEADEPPAPVVGVRGERVVAKADRQTYSRRMEPNGVSESAAPTLFDDPGPAETVVPEQAVATTPAPADAVQDEADVVQDEADVVQDEADVVPEEVAPGRYGEGSADAVPHQGPPDGFTIKGNAQSMLFHTPDSPYYGRTKPEVWFRTEADAERAGFTKYVRRPRKSPGAEK